MHSFLFRELQLMTGLLLVFSTHTRLKYMGHLSKTVCVDFSIFDPVLFLLNIIFLLKKSKDSFALKHNSFQNKNNRTVTDSFAP